MCLRLIYRERVEIIEPESVRNMVIEKVMSLNKKYIEK